MNNADAISKIERIKEALNTRHANGINNNAFCTVKCIREIVEEDASPYGDGLYQRIDRLIRDLSLSCAYDMPSFWAKDKKGKEEYVVISDKFHKGYQKAIADVENGIKEIFGKEKKNE